MDLSLIQTHLDNFVHTWEGWGKIAANLPTVLNNAVDIFFGLQSDEYEVGDAFSNTSSALLSSK
ncbi:MULTISPECIES: hypothetical protein [Corynebacterium]|uniref:hypothetical protein n=1 Tax=Corynebacterium TaxID=1716 RepID=UPI0008A290FC|nr:MULTISPECIES: hypothetical protein [Corynebacterium]OFN75096.1 hypothetical protein HMPREF2537_00445 [Corynebacterium sp. HMSC074E01]OFP65957.1 hypothetical protein HMPREF2978_06070 [Corynebacterium sp. HMSC074C01]TRX52260.1 hypothetical protein FNY91_06940 [Corynebacterium guaraldiae]